MRKRITSIAAVICQFILMLSHQGDDHYWFVVLESSNLPSTQKPWCKCQMRKLFKISYKGLCNVHVHTLLITVKGIARKLKELHTPKGHY